MFIELMPYQKELSKLALDVKNLLNIDVVIVDRWLSQVINTFAYLRKPVDIRINSVVGSIIVTGKPQVVTDRYNFKACMTCPDYQTCELESMVGVPLISDSDCVGAILVLINSKRTNLLVNHTDDLLSFLTKLACLIVKELQVDVMSEQIDQFWLQMVQILDLLPDCFAFVDDENRVQFLNKSFIRCFGIRQEDFLNVSLDTALREFRSSPGDVKLQVDEIYVSGDGAVMQLISIEEVQLPVKGTKMYQFREMDVTELLSRSKPYDAKVKLSSFWGISSEMRAAEFAATMATRNKLHVLVEGKCPEQNHELIKILSCYAPEESMGPTILDCSADAEELWHLILGNGIDRPTFLWPMRRSSLCLVHIQNMPLYLQKRLYTSLINCQINGGLESKVRIFASSDCDLVTLCEQGMFFEDLFHMIAQNHIVIPEIKNHREDIEFCFRKFVSEFSMFYGVSGITVTSEFFDALEQSGMYIDYISLRRIAEYQIANLQGETVITPDTWAAQQGLFSSEDKTDQIAMESQIRSLIKQGCKKSEIAARVGVSRATLYRWIKKYDLSD